MKDQKFGIEIELTGITRETGAKVIAATLPSNTLGDGATYRYVGGTYRTWAVTGTDGRVWKCMSDSSVTGYPDYCCEVVSPICTWEDIETIQKIVRALRAAGARADGSCGIHVHVNAAPHTPKTLRTLVNLVAAKEDWLTQALQISADRRGCWCLPVDPDFLHHLNTQRPRTSEELAKLWYRYSGKYGERPDAERRWETYAHDHYDPSRYRLLNLHAVWQKGTVEFRAFNGTTHAGKIKAYIQLCLAISDKALKSASASPKKTETDNPAYFFRCWLLQLKMIGPEFATARKHLTAHMSGNAAWRHGAPTNRRGGDEAPRQDDQDD